MYLGTLFESPVKTQTGEYLPYEEVANRLEDETVNYACEFGLLEEFTNTLNVVVRVELAMYEKAVAWIKDVVYGSQFTKERYVTD